MASKGEKRVVSVIGGDQRSLYAARYLAKKGWLCRLFYLGDSENPCAKGFEKGCCLAPYKLAEAMADADCLLLPLPLSLDGGHLNAPFSGVQPPLSAIEEQLPGDLPLFGGGLCRPALEKRKGLTFDFLKDEDFLVKNALPTAEGALGLALLHYTGVLRGSRCAIFGYGRIAFALLPMLRSLGAHCTVFARKEEARTAARGAGADALPFEALENTLPTFDVLFNTVPDVVLSPAHAPLLKDDALFIELASRPYGMSDEARKIVGPRHLFALGLPGKHAPAYAGGIIGQTILSVLNGSK